MSRHIPGLHSRAQTLEGLFLVRIDKASYRLHPQKPFLALQFTVLEPVTLESQSFHARLYCTRRALWKLEWFLRDFGYDPELLDRDQVDEKALLGLRGVVRTSHTTFNGRSYQNLDSFAPAEDWPTLNSAATGTENELADGLLASRRSANTCVAHAAIDIATWTAGERKKLVPQWLLVVVSKMH